MTRVKCCSSKWLYHYELDMIYNPSILLAHARRMSRGDVLWNTALVPSPQPACGSSIGTKTLFFFFFCAEILFRHLELWQRARYVIDASIPTILQPQYGQDFTSIYHYSTFNSDRTSWPSTDHSAHPFTMFLLGCLECIVSFPSTLFVESLIYF